MSMTLLLARQRLIKVDFFQEIPDSHHEGDLRKRLRLRRPVEVGSLEADGLSPVKIGSVE